MRARSVRSAYCLRPSATARSASCRAWATVSSASARAAATSRCASARASATSCSASVGGAGPGVLGLLLGLGDDLVAAVEHVLRVVQLARERLADVVEQLEDVAARDDAVRGHRQTARLLDHA